MRGSAPPNPKGLPGFGKCKRYFVQLFFCLVHAASGRVHDPRRSSLTILRIREQLHISYVELLLAVFEEGQKSTWLFRKLHYPGGKCEAYLDVVLK